jgi:predicted alpha/beta superfamily hydrolase
MARDVAGVPVSLPRTDSRQIDVNGRVYQILVAWPSEEPPSGGYPAVFVLDPHAAFSTTVECLRARTPRAAATGVRPAVVIGVGYPTGDLQDRSRRMFDCTPAGLQPTDPDALRDVGPDGFGGADQFLETLVGAVRASVANDFPLSPIETTLIGHSLSALFVVNTLVRTPWAFRTYIAASPSLWWAPDYLFNEATSLPERLGSGSHRRALVTVGEYEQKLAPWQAASAAAEGAKGRRSSRRMVDHVLKMGRKLEILQASGHRVECAELPGEDHASVLPVTISRGLRFALMD